MLKDDDRLPRSDVAASRLAAWRAVAPEERTLAIFGFLPEPGSDWLTFRPSAIDRRFNDVIGEVKCRVEPDGKARFRCEPSAEKCNLNDVLHGGFLLGLIDIAIFIGPAATGIQRALNGVTIDLATQFLGPTRFGTPIDLFVEVMRETGRLIFTRGTIEQDGAVCVTFSATTRKSGSGPR